MHLFYFQFGNVQPILMGVLLACEVSDSTLVEISIEYSQTKDE